MSITERKKELRRAVLTQSRAMSPEQMMAQAQGVFSAIEQMDVFRRAKTIAFYYSMADELPTHDVVERWSATKRIALPIIEGGEMHFVEYQGSDAMVEAELRILEPSSRVIVAAESIDLMIVPGVAFDMDGGRLGRGRGYYDRYMAGDWHIPTIGVCLGHQMVDSVPKEDHDRVLDEVVYCEHLNI